MAFVGNFNIARIKYGHLRMVCNTPLANDVYSFIFMYGHFAKRRRFSTASSQQSMQPELSGESAYEILGVSEMSSFEEIKSSFRKLAKETHPDLVGSEDSDSSNRFVQIVAAYEILSDPLKRAHYDEHLLAQRRVVVDHHKHSSTYHMYARYASSSNQIEVVEWLRWYRNAVKEILSEKKMIGGTSYFDVLQRDFYSAVQAAYHGPEIETINLLPDRFEAEERSFDDTPEVLHLVSGRTLFGAVCVADKIRELANPAFRKLASSDSFSLNASEFLDNIESMTMKGGCGGRKTVRMDSYNVEDLKSDAYKTLELHVFGKMVATATRVPPRNFSKGTEDEDCEDEINVFLCSSEQPFQASIDYTLNTRGNIDVSMMPLGKIIGLGTSAEEGYCSVYNSSGTKTHTILKHRTLLVKHLHWFQQGDEVSICECRCTRARLPPSKYWLFEPRCSMHDIGGWYVETYGLDKKRQNIPSQRYWDGFATVQQSEKRLHPAFYLLALAYRTLDLENGRKKKVSVKNVVEQNLLKIFGWCKKRL